MSWFTKFFFRSKKSVQKPVSSPCKEDEDKPFTAEKYLGFYDDGIVFYNETFAKYSRLSKKYMHVDALSDDVTVSFYSVDMNASFDNFAEAYNAFCDLEKKGSMNIIQHLKACNSLIIMFNKQYSSITVLRSKTFVYDYPKYFRIVQLMLEHDVHILIQADLYRQISLFKKSLDLLDNVYFKTDFERELRDEIRFRACNGIRYPFMICDVDNLRNYSDDSGEHQHLDWFFDVHYNFIFGKSIYRTAQGGGNWAMAIR